MFYRLPIFIGRKYYAYAWLGFWSRWLVDRFIKTLFRNFQKCRAILFDILIDKQILEKVFCSNIAPSLSSGNHLFYKAEYMGQSCPNQVWAITFDWGALATWNKHFWTAFWRLFSGIPHLPGLGDVPGASNWHLNFQVPGALFQVTGKVGKWAFKMQFRNAYFRSLVHSGRKFWPKPNSGDFASCVLPCKIGGAWNNDRPTHPPPHQRYLQHECSNKGGWGSTVFWTKLKNFTILWGGGASLMVSSMPKYASKVRNQSWGAANAKNIITLPASSSSSNFLRLFRFRSENEK